MTHRQKVELIPRGEFFFGLCIANLQPELDRLVDRPVHPMLTSSIPKAQLAAILARHAGSRNPQILPELFPFCALDTGREFGHIGRPPWFAGEAIHSLIQVGNHGLDLQLHARLRTSQFDRVLDNRRSSLRACSQRTGHRSSGKRRKAPPRRQGAQIQR